MKVRMKELLLLLGFAVIVASCGGGAHKEPARMMDENMMEVRKAEVVETPLLTAETQAQLTPDAVIETLKKGNMAFMNDQLTIRNNSERVRAAAGGQFPMAAIVSCLDSRVPVEDVFHAGIGDLFVARVAGNTVNDDILGSLEFACKVAGAKVILVLGHEYCGAVQSAIDDVKLGNITAMLSRIRPAVKESEKTFTGEKKSSNNHFVQAVADENVRMTMNEIRSKSSILRDMEKEGKLKIIGGMYHMHTGEVKFF